MDVAEQIVGFIRQKVSEAGADGVVVGVSGGIDSAVVAALCTRALGKEKVLALVLPEEGTEAEELADAHGVVKWLGVKAEEIDFSGAYNELGKKLPGFSSEKTKVARGNLKARLRMCALYYYSNTRNLLVVGTGNKSELMMGYFTRYGDGGVDFLPIGGLLKRQVRELAVTLGGPEKIIKKVPTAGLWKGQTDEGEMGVTYAVLDAVLEEAEKGTDAQGITKKLGVEKKIVDEIWAKIKKNKFKAKMPEICELG